MMNRTSKNVPVLRFKGFSDEWQQRIFSQLVRRVTTQIQDNHLPNVAFDDIKAGEGKLSTSLKKLSSGKQGIHFYPGNILFGKLRPYLDNRLLASFEGLAVGDFWIFESKENSNSNFIFSLIQTSRFKYISNLSSGSKMPRSDWNLVSNYKFKIPKVDEQNKIGLLINVLDIENDLQQRHTEQLKQLRKALLQQLFVDKSGSKVDFDNENEIWKSYKLADLISNQFKGSAKEKDLNEGKVKYLDTDSLNSNKFTLTDGVKDTIKSDILILWDGSKAGTIYTGFEGVLGSTLKNYRIKDEFDSKFIYYALKRRRQEIYHNYRTPNIPHVQKNFDSIFEIMVPSLKVQKKISSILDSVSNEINLREDKLIKLNNLKKFLLQNMFI